MHQLSVKLIAQMQAIDLLNVAFENPRSLANRSKQESGSAAIDPYSTPDRLAGRASHSELSRLCPSRQWNFVQVNVPFSEFQDHKQHIVDLMRPSNTAMDLVSGSSRKSQHQ